MGRKGTGGHPSDQIYGGTELEGSGIVGAAGGGDAAGISLAALLAGAGL